MAGWPDAPRRPFAWPSGVLELPVPVGRFGPLLLPFLGGMYLRWLPPWRLRTLVRSWVLENGDAHLWSYCHPYDLDASEGLVRRADAGLAGSVMLWLNRGTTLPRLEGLLRGRRSESFATRLAALRAGAATWHPAVAGAALRPAPVG
jgi:hypothetical protein